ncbi:predicted protein [Lichtheimia corymbifera JMRC:FSU:9682]|uniref:EF-hand domain-containing protein n=1 Tax=Lichtheimia corymbifera JMRC:FSU:9682 TaxID=1263082 RepID=A0A068RQ08_9FUNG|nr:predicted protein [Lichtheimia corymbifera JMRC:FSU:9682]
MLTEEDQTHISSDEEDEDYTTVGSVDSIASTISRASKATKTASKCDNCNKDRSKAKFYDRVVEITSTSGDAALLCLPCRIEWIKHHEESGAITQFEESSTMTKSRINQEFPKLKNKQLHSSSTKRGYKGTTVNLYSATVVFQAAREVYGGWVGLQERQLEKKQRKVNREKQRESRKTAIFSLLDENGAGALRFNELDTDIQKYVEQSRVPKRSKASRSVLQEEFMAGMCNPSRLYISSWRLY